MKKQSKINQLVLLGVLSATLFSSCGGVKTPNVTDPAGGATAPATSSGGNAYQSPVGDYGSTLPQPTSADPLPPDQSPQEPLDTPEPLPAPTNPVQPGAPFALRAVSNTTAFAVPRFSKWFTINGTYVYVHLTWQPVSGAKEYWIYKDQLPDFKEARRETAQAIVQAGFASVGYKDGLEPPNLKSGSLWDRLKRAIGTVTNRPGQMYSYKVIAADGNGIPMSETTVVQTVPLPAISSATMDPVENNGVSNTRNPLFTWKDAQSGTRPDGYYISVFPTVQFTGETIPPTSLAYWSTFRPAGTNVARYGEDTANLTSYQGTRPFNINFDLAPGKAYSWTVVGIMTDTHDMRTANAISRSWSGFGNFSISPTAPATAPQSAPVAASSYSSYGYNANAGYGTTYNAASTGYASGYSNAYPQTSAYGTSYPQTSAYGTSYPQTSAYGSYPQQSAYGSYPQTSGYAYGTNQNQRGY